MIQQDCFFDGLPWIKTHQEALAAYFDFVGAIGASAAFPRMQEIPQAALDELRNDVPPADQLRFASIAMQHSADPGRRFFVALSKRHLIRKIQGREAARAHLDVVKADYPSRSPKPTTSA